MNRAVKNNPGKFPEGYVFTLQSSGKKELVKNIHRFNRMKHSSVLPAAFTCRIYDNTQSV
ncbi:MAG: ORF6N domain-containing protein [Tannerella sp.]|nr:ORF6N domain-containing protein [Tannerella sp.]